MVMKKYAIETLGYISMLTGLSGALLLGLNIEASPYAFMLFMVNSVTGQVYATFRGLRPLLLLFTGFTLINILGLFRYLEPGEALATTLASLVLIAPMLLSMGQLVKQRSRSCGQAKVIETLGYLAMLLSIMGAVIMALNIGISPVGFLFWTAGASVNVYYAARNNAWPVVWLDLGYLVPDLVGVQRHFGWEMMGVVLVFAAAVVGYSVVSQLARNQALKEQPATN